MLKIKNYKRLIFDGFNLKTYVKKVTFDPLLITL